MCMAMSNQVPSQPSPGATQMPRGVTQETTSTKSYNDPMKVREIEEIKEIKAKVLPTKRLEHLLKVVPCIVPPRLGLHQRPSGL